MRLTSSLIPLIKRRLGPFTSTTANRLNYRTSARLHAMASSSAFDLSPPIRRDMRDTLDRDAFKKSFTVLAAIVPFEKIGTFTKSNVLKKLVGFLLVWMLLH